MTDLIFIFRVTFLKPTLNASENPVTVYVCDFFKSRPFSDLLWILWNLQQFLFYTTELCLRDCNLTDH